MRTWDLLILTDVVGFVLNALPALGITVLIILKTRAALQLENLALRHQLGGQYPNLPGRS